jgi:hypothetical protein
MICTVYARAAGPRRHLHTSLLAAIWRASPAEVEVDEYIADLADMRTLEERVSRMAALRHSPVPSDTRALGDEMACGDRTVLGVNQQSWAVLSELEKEEAHSGQSSSCDAEIVRVVQESWVVVASCDRIASARTVVADLLCANPRQERRCGDGALFLHMCREVYSQRGRQQVARKRGTPLDTLTLVLVIFCLGPASIAFIRLLGDLDLDEPASVR